MLELTTLSFAQLRNAEHVAFFTNVRKVIDKFGTEGLGLDATQFTQFTTAVDEVQDIVLKTHASMYTADMESLDKDRDRIYRMVRYKLQAVTFASPDSLLASYKDPLEKYILGKYNADIVKLPYQEETAHLIGFIKDMRHYFTSDDIEAMAIGENLDELDQVNKTFIDVYLNRADERSLSTADHTKALRLTCEELYKLFCLHFLYVVSTQPDTEKGLACTNIIGVINELIRDARQHLNSRLGKGGTDSAADDLGDDVSPIPYPTK